MAEHSAGKNNKCCSTSARLLLFALLLSLTQTSSSYRTSISEDNKPFLAYGDQKRPLYWGYGHPGFHAYSSKSVEVSADGIRFAYSSFMEPWDPTTAITAANDNDATAAEQQHILLCEATDNALCKLLPGNEGVLFPSPNYEGPLMHTALSHFLNNSMLKTLANKAPCHTPNAGKGKTYSPYGSKRYDVSYCEAAQSGFVFVTDNRHNTIAMVAPAIQPIAYSLLALV